MSLKIILAEILVLFMIFVFSSCEDVHHSQKERNNFTETNENSRSNEKVNIDLLDTLLRISKESAYKSSELSPIDLWNDHPDVAIMMCEITTIRDSNIFRPKKDTIKTIGTLVFMRSENEWQFERGFGSVNKEK